MNNKAAKNNNINKDSGVAIAPQNDKTKDYFHPTRFAALEKEGKEIGWIAEIHPRIANKFGIEKRVAVLEVTIES